MASDKEPPSLRPWTITATRITFEDRWLKVRTDDCLTPEGVEVAPYHVIESRDWTAIVALTADLRLVLIREYRHARGIVIDGLPGGVVEFSDDGTSVGSAEAGAKRELLEETGYGGGRFEPILTVYPDPANQTNTATAFLALGVEPQGPQSLDPSEAIEVVLADLPDVLARLANGELRMHAVHVAALWSAAVRLMRDTDPQSVPTKLRDRLLAMFTGT
jgi:ADP-ribose pyrophosphatase